jgi:photosystem II CP43 chlorophyll apoprotein
MLGKYLMRAPTGEIILVAKQCDSISAVRLEPLRGSERFRLKQAENDIQPWQERRAAEYMTHVL